MGLFSFLFGGAKKRTEAIKNAIAAGGMIIDVRTPPEFQSGHAKGSVNIPLHKLEDHIAKIQKASGPVVLCCRSGQRAGSAKAILEKHGIKSINAGPWQNVKTAQE